MKFKFQAMDCCGREVVDVVEAVNEKEAQARIRERGLFVTKLCVTKPIPPTLQTTRVRCECDFSWRYFCVGLFFGPNRHLYITLPFIAVQLWREVVKL